MIRLAFLTLVAGAALVAPATSSHAAACSGASGVTVVVDFASLGGGSQTRCAPGDPASGVEVLRSAGFTPTRAAQQPGYFVCRIDGKPASDPCQRASPADAYWSYWHGTPGGSWTFSNAGAADHDPAPGSVDGWAFGAGDPPSAPPPRRSQPSPSAAPPPASPSTAPSPRLAARGAAASPTPAPATSAVARPSANLSPSPSPALAGGPASAPASPSPDPSVEPAPQVAVPADDDPGSPTGPLAAAGVLAVLAALGLAQARRRR